MKILGTDDSVNSCDCCGKSGLKHTVIVEVNGEILHYGSTCATRHTGLKSGQIKKQIENIAESIKHKAKEEFESSDEYLLHRSWLAQLNRDKVPPGKEFYAAQLPSSILADAKKQEIAKKYSLEVYTF
jgi:hypothetical protein